MTRYFEATIRNLWFKNPIVSSGAIMQNRQRMPLRIHQFGRIVVAEEFDNSPMMTIVTFGYNRNIRGTLEYEPLKLQSQPYWVHRSHLTDIKSLEFNFPV